MHRLITNAFSGLDSSVISPLTPVGPKRSALTVFSLLHSSSLSNWSRSVNCDVGFFKDVLLELKNKTEEDPENGDCAFL